ncbi:MAG: Holliday junction resolvase RuvX [Acutalibacteraceae bacterium]|nr:Holliday junction resolvase RuvX [Acutalibacteraceae bacterium]
MGEKSGIETILWDERGTTVTAHNYLSMNDVRGKKRKQTVDAVAAVIILEDYMRSLK